MREDLISGSVNEMGLSTRIHPLAGGRQVEGPGKGGWEGGRCVCKQSLSEPSVFADVGNKVIS